MSSSRPPFLVVAHPGHELRVHGWLEREQPVVWVLTDGSGSSGHGRLGSTENVLARTGARAGSIFGRLTDREAYALLLDGDVPAALALAEELAASLIAEGVEQVAGDALEGFNPVHDLCRVLVDAAVASAGRRTGRSIANLDFPLEAAPDSPGLVSASDVRIELDDASVARKIAAARAYPELQGEVDAALARYGDAAFRIERLRPVDGSQPVAERLDGQPSYEEVGEARVAAGLYDRVLRFRDHFLPLAEAVRHWAQGD